MMATDSDKSWRRVVLSEAELRLMVVRVLSSLASK